MLKRLVKFLLITLLFVVSYVVFLVATLPAEKAWRITTMLVPVTRLPVQPLGFKGTIWHGEALIRYQQIKGVMTWNLKFNDLLTGKLGADVSWHNSLSDIKAQLTVSPIRYSIKLLPGYAELKPFNPLVRREKITLDGRVNIRSLTLETDGETIFTANADLNWTGGNLRYPAGAYMRNRTFPSFTAKMHKQNGNVILDIKDAGSSINAISAIVKSDGWATVQIKRRLLDLAKEAWPSNSKPSDTVFKVKHKLLPLTKKGG